MLKKLAPSLIVLIAIFYNSECVEDVVAFINAAQHGDYNTTAQMVAGHPLLLNTTHPTKPYTALYAAAEAGHLDLVILLVQHGASISAQGLGRTTPLHRAAYNGHRAVVRFLVESLEKLGEREQSLKAEDDVLHTPLDAAASKGHFDIVRDLVQAGANVNEHTICNMSITLLLASKANNSSIIHYLLEQGALYREENIDYDADGNQVEDRIAVCIPNWQQVQQRLPQALNQCYPCTKFPEDLEKLTLSFLSSMWAAKPKT